MNKSISDFFGTIKSKRMNRSQKAMLVSVAAVAIAQFIRPAKNLSNDDTYHLRNTGLLPSDIEATLDRSCYNCHSNYTEYPWYNEVEPVGWLVAHDVNEGKEHLNFSEFTNKPLWKQYQYLGEISEVVHEGEMPMKLYTAFGLHKESKLSEADRNAIVSWANGLQDTMRNRFPADSLQLPPNAEHRH